MQILSRIFKCKEECKETNLRSNGAKWVEENLGAEYVDGFLIKYDTLNSGGIIGNFFETVAFTDLVERIRKETNNEDN